MALLAVELVAARSTVLAAQIGGAIRDAVEMGPLACDARLFRFWPLRRLTIIGEVPTGVPCTPSVTARELVSCNFGKVLRKKQAIGVLGKP